MADVSSADEVRAAAPRRLAVAAPLSGGPPHNNNTRAIRRPALTSLIQCRLRVQCHHVSFASGTICEKQSLCVRSRRSYAALSYSAQNEIVR